MVKQTLILVEGKRKDSALMERLFEVYFPNTEKNIVAYETNIYALYGQLISEYSDGFSDLLMHLRSREPDEERKKIFDKRYSEILLVFDFDPQDRYYESTKLQNMMAYFNEATNRLRGRLYINYPMVESFCHIGSWNESRETFNARFVEKAELENKQYKSRVNTESCCTDIRKFNKEEFNAVIDLNLAKVSHLLGNPSSSAFECDANILRRILEVECNAWEEKSIVYVLNTCVLYIYEHYPKKFHS